MRVITTTGMIMTKMSWLMTISVIDLTPRRPKRLQPVTLAKKSSRLMTTIGSLVVLMRIRRPFLELFVRRAGKGAGLLFALALWRRKLKHAPALMQPV